LSEKNSPRSGWRQKAWYSALLAVGASTNMLCLWPTISSEAIAHGLQEVLVGGDDRAVEIELDDQPATAMAATVAARSARRSCF
jgi:hypothetical protein